MWGMEGGVCENTRKIGETKALTVTTNVHNLCISQCFLSTHLPELAKLEPIQGGEGRGIVGLFLFEIVQKTSNLFALWDIDLNG